ncbi:MAG: hypothetical protein K8J31_08735 [Anaerolineae bacterium]|nr:hypothetical protein [Anaerolineae bacterium]
MEAQEAFQQQSRRSFWMSLLSRLLHRCNELLEFNQVVRDGPFGSQHDRGVQTVELKKIVGTIGRRSDFDRDFRPRRQNMEDRWIRIHELYEAGELLPVVELYKIGDSYFVSDGHHRISVARTNGQLYIDAHVIEVQVRAMRPAYA